MEIKISLHLFWVPNSVCHASIHKGVKGFFWSAILFVSSFHLHCECSWCWKVSKPLIVVTLCFSIFISLFVVLWHTILSSNKSCLKFCSVNKIQFRWLYYFNSLCFSYWKVLYHKSLLHCFCDDILQDIWRARVLANTAFLLDCIVHSYHEEADFSYDQIQIRPIFLREAGIPSYPLSDIYHFIYSIILSTSKRRRLHFVMGLKLPNNPFHWFGKTNGASNEIWIHDL